MGAVKIVTGRTKVGERGKKRWVALLGLMLVLAPNVFADKPARIVSMNLCTDELVVRLAEPGRVAALTRYAADSDLSTVSEEAKNYRLIRGRVEEVLTLSPDIVLAGRFTDPPAVWLLKRMGIAVRLIDLPHDFAGIRQNIRDVALVLGEAARGEKLITEMDAALAAVPRTLQAGGRPRVLFYQRGGYSPGSGTFEDSILREAGAENLAGQLGIQGYGVIPLEVLLKEHPDWVLFLTSEKNSASVTSQLLFHPVLRHNQALRQRTLDSRSLHCGGPASVEAVKALTQTFA